ncbi:MAG: SAM-dependent chlorinase/fluorinase [Chlorobi bacterium]|nr:SAM-dependent chlorinase/fluorinase [Chlorobiota bacterium]
MVNSSLAVVITSYDARDTIFLSVISSLLNQGYSPVVLNGLSKDLIRSTAYVLKYSISRFPRNTLFIVLNHLTASTVVAHHNGKIIIAPNNGIITMIQDNSHWQPESISVFDSPIPALLQTGRLEEMLSESKEGHIIEAFFPEPVVDETSKHILATIIHIDSSGNVITNVNNLERFSMFSVLAPKDLSFVRRNVTLFSFEFVDVYPSYPFNEVPGKHIVFRDEMGYLSCGIVNGNLAEMLNVNEYVQIKISLMSDQTKQATPFLSIPEN